MGNETIRFFAKSIRKNRSLDESKRLVLQIDISDKRFDNRQ